MEQVVNTALENGKIDYSKSNRLSTLNFPLTQVTDFSTPHSITATKKRLEKVSKSGSPTAENAKTYLLRQKYVKIYFFIKLQIKVKKYKCFVPQLPNFGNRATDVEKFISLSLKNLGLDYIDMYLMHMPFSFVQSPTDFSPATNPDGSPVLDLDADPVTTWKVWKIFKNSQLPSFGYMKHLLQEMEKQVEKGRAKSIGLSNFNEEQISAIMNKSKIQPSNVQVIVSFTIHASIHFTICTLRFPTGRVACLFATKISPRILQEKQHSVDRVRPIGLSWSANPLQNEIQLHGEQFPRPFQPGPREKNRRESQQNPGASSSATLGPTRDRRHPEKLVSGKNQTKH